MPRSFPPFLPCLASHFRQGRVASVPPARRALARLDSPGTRRHPLTHGGTWAFHRARVVFWGSESRVSSGARAHGLRISSVPKWVYTCRLFVVSARTNKRSSSSRYGLLPGVRTRGGQSGGTEDQPRCRELWRSRTPNARSLSHSRTGSPSSPPPPGFTQSPREVPPRSRVRDGQHSPHKPGSS